MIIIAHIQLQSNPAVILQSMHPACDMLPAQGVLPYVGTSLFSLS